MGKILLPDLGKSSGDPSFKINQAKWSGSVAEVVEHLLCKLKALSSYPTPKLEKLE
jgi:hypothetical protein